MNEENALIDDWLHDAKDERCLAQVRALSSDPRGARALARAALFELALVDTLTENRSRSELPSPRPVRQGRRPARSRTRRPSDRRAWQRPLAVISVLVAVVLGLWTMASDAPTPTSDDATTAALAHGDAALALGGEAQVPGHGLVRALAASHYRLEQDGLHLDEGHLEISHDPTPNSTAAVHTPHGRIDPIGTRFSVLCSEELSICRVDEGRVRVSSAGAQREVGAGNGVVFSTQAIHELLFSWSPAPQASWQAIAEASAYEGWPTLRSQSMSPEEGHEGWHPDQRLIVFRDDGLALLHGTRARLLLRVHVQHAGQVTLTLSLPPGDDGADRYVYWKQALVAGWQYIDLDLVSAERGPESPSAIDSDIFALGFYGHQLGTIHLSSFHLIGPASTVDF